MKEYLIHILHSLLSKHVQVRYRAKENHASSVHQFIKKRWRRDCFYLYGLKPAGFCFEKRICFNASLSHKRNYLRRLLGFVWNLCPLQHL